MLKEDALNRNWSIRLPVKDRAASLFASGDNHGAQEVLIKYLNETSGKCDKSVWFMLFDLYWSLHQIEPFERLGKLYAQNFLTSPPPWTTPLEGEIKSVRVSGKNALTIDGELSKITMDRLRELVNSARVAKIIRLDVSRAKLNGTKKEKEKHINYWHELMRRIRHYKINVFLMGEYEFVDSLMEQIENELNNSKEAWQVALEFMQWRGSENAYDDLAEKYLLVFDELPLGYEEQYVLAVSPDEVNNSNELPIKFPGLTGVIPEEVIKLPMEGTINHVDEWLSHAQESLLHNGKLILDASEMIRITYEAASAFSIGLTERVNDNLLSSIKLLYPTELVAAMFDSSGLSSWAIMIPKKR